MPRFVADEGFRRIIVREVLRHIPDVDIVLAQDVGLSGASDPTILEWAARNGRVTLTSDKRTMIEDAEERLRYGLPMPGAVVVHQDVPIGNAVRGLLQMIRTSREDEWENRVRYVRRR